MNTIRITMALLIPLAMFTSAYGQKRVVTGQVLRYKGKPLQGAWVAETGTTNATLSDTVGRFTLRLLSDQAKSITISFAGYQPQEVTLTWEDSYTVYLRVQEASGIRRITPPERYMLNPAVHPRQTGVWLLNIYGDAKTNTFNMDHFAFNRLGKTVSFLDKTVTMDDAMERMDNRNYMAVDARLGTGVGIRTEKGFVSLEVTTRLDMYQNISKSMLGFLKAVENKVGRGQSYDLSNTVFNAMWYTEAGIGYSRSFLDNSLTVGVKGKGIMGQALASFEINNGFVERGTEWGQRFTCEGKTYLRSPLSFASGQGAGFDFGLSYSLKQLFQAPDGPSHVLGRLTLSAAVTDVGFIRWDDQTEVRAFTLQNHQVAIESQSTDNLLEYGDDVWMAIEGEGELSKKAVTLKTRHRTTLGLEYELLTDRLFVNAQSTTLHAKPDRLTEMSLSGTVYPLRWLGVMLGYSFMYSDYRTFGAAIYLVPSKAVNLYLSSQYVIYHANRFLPTSSRAVNLNVALSIPFGTRR